MRDDTKAAKEQAAKEQATKEAVTSAAIPAGSDLAREVHRRDDVDFDRLSHHHTLGEGNHQAAPGDVLAALKIMASAAGGYTGAHVGPWNTGAAGGALPNGACNVPFTTPYNCLASIRSQIGGYTTGVAVNIHVYLDNVDIGGGLLNSAAPVNVHLLTNPIFPRVLLTKGLHYIGVRQFGGLSDSGDSWIISMDFFPTFT